MRKVFLGVLTTIIALSVGTISAFAEEPIGGRNYVDSDGDGICDYANTICGYMDEDGDGICDNCGIYHISGLNKEGKNFVDSDGDGVCDYYTDGQARGCRQGGYGVNFADADGDGICDNYTVGQGRGSGRGRGCRGGRC